MNYLILIALLSNTIFAHSGGPPKSFGFFEGLTHPIFGIDHLLAMLCVGMISSRIGGKAIWQVPSCFVLVMAIGCVVGFYGTTNSFIEPIISFSVIVFGILFLTPRFLTLTTTFVTVALFAIVHGYAHGKEMPIFVLPEIYIAGFMISTIAVHIFGVGIGELINKLPNARRITQMTGGLLIIAGTALFINAV